MKKNFLLGMASVAMLAGGLSILRSNQTTAPELSPLQIQNIMALTQSERECTNPNGYRRILEGNEKIYDCCYIQQIGKGKENCYRW